MGPRLILAAALAAGVLAAPAVARAETVLVTEVVGDAEIVRPGDFGIAKAKCPRGYQVISAGLLLGAIEPVSDFRDSDGSRVWKSDGYNSETAFTAYGHRVQATCIKGKKGIKFDSVSSSRVSAASAGGGDRDLIEQARSDFSAGSRLSAKGAP